MAICCDFVTAPYAVPEFLRFRYSLTTAWARQAAEKSPSAVTQPAAGYPPAGALAAAYRKYASLGPARAAWHLGLFEQPAESEFFSNLLEREEGPDSLRALRASPLDSPFPSC